MTVKKDKPKRRNPARKTISMDELEDALLTIACDQVFDVMEKIRAKLGPP